MTDKIRPFPRAPGPDAAGTGRPEDEKNTGLSPEKEYERLNPGGGPPGQQQEQGKESPRTTRDDGGAGIPGSQNEDVKKKPR